MKQSKRIIWPDDAPDFDRSSRDNWKWNRLSSSSATMLRTLASLPPIRGDDDLFAHFSGIRAESVKSRKESQRVSFDLRASSKSKQAANIQPLSKREAARGWGTSRV
ncbi:cold-shock protein [Paraburkholderia fungorum]|uniref:cold-shock protein n=1 Tax=Paraburkholderia fungorum TaxID=134537 RepID=UPI003F55A643